MKQLICLSFWVLFTTICPAQTVGLVLSDLKTPPQYLSHFLTKKPMQKVDNQQVAPQTPRPIPLVFCVETLPFFCKIEHKMGLNQKLPVKFRLGDVQYVDEMEGKRKAN